ncbi:unnamed protein product [Cylindrotheca closterium]|uniref:Uncharacterized protein n=1 Tax=Cylindrotheca closterium TaxID=2856 RepID=A0AAD2G1G1_9STRA|nr:unnamed protein product [Cylindrotheca closterium]
MQLQLQKITLTKVLILSVATYITVSGLSREWFRSIRHSLERMHRNHCHNNNNNNNRDSQASSQKYLRGQGSPSFSSGVWFSKSIELVNDIARIAPIEFQFDSKHCQDTDCQYQWGDVISMNYTLSSNDIDMEEGDYTSSDDSLAHVEGTFMINGQEVPWTFRCNLCGDAQQQQQQQHCETDGFPQGLEVVIDMPDCQQQDDGDDDAHVSTSKQGSLSVALQSASKKIPSLQLEGTLEVYSHPNELLAQIGMRATIAA